MDRMNRFQQDQSKLQPQKPRRVMIGTPSYDGRIDVWYANSLLQTVKSGMQLGIEIIPIWLSYDALIQRARNDLIAMMLEFDCDDIVFIDSDIDWEVDDFFKLLSHPVDVVGGTYRKKGDPEIYVAKILDQTQVPDPATHLLSVNGLGTGFLRFSRNAAQRLWDNSVPYEEKDQGKIRRWIFDVIVDNGDLISEDILVCQRLKDLGMPVWLDTSITCGHTGIKRFVGNFDQWYKNIQTNQFNQTPVGYGFSNNIKSLYE